MRIKELTHEKIKQGLLNGSKSAKEILDNLKTDESISLLDLYKLILKDLEKMEYDVVYNDELINAHKRQGIVSSTTNKTICLNKDFPQKARFEALIHEYVHIRDKTLKKISTTEMIAEPNKYLDFDIKIDMITYTLIMPPRQIKENLLDNKYDINIVLNMYKDIEKCSVLQWLTLNSLIACHFAWVMLIKKNKQGIDKIYYDHCNYDQKTNPKQFDKKIKAILDNPDSAAAQAVKKLNNVDRTTAIKEIDYKCYAYYERNLKKDICNVLLKTNTIQYDRLLVIGWLKIVYDTMERTLDYAKEMYAAD
jgi:hypothetical protein